MELPNPLSHAYLITGGSGESRGALIQRLTAAYLCEGDRPPCGVCGGIARYFNVDPTIVRVATALLVAFAGMSLWVYIIAALIMPKEC